MVILGLDPGYDLTGFAIIDVTSDKNMKILHGGVIKTSAGLDYWERIIELQSDLGVVLDRYQIDYAGLEQLFFSKNVKTAIKVAQARGVIGAEVTKHGVPLMEFTPPQIKSAVVGKGNASKLDVQLAVQCHFNLKEIPKPDDFADALGVALCTYYTASNALGTRLYLNNV